MPAAGIQSLPLSLWDKKRNLKFKINMAEEEKIREHAKHALQALTDKTKKWKDRIKDFLWEVFIILVAVNITLWFHSWSEKRHERALEKEFLIDIRNSLAQDTAYIRYHNNFMTNGPIAYYDSVLSQINKKKIDAQYIDSLYFQLLANTGVATNYSIYQSLSSGNNLTLFENKKLLNDIIFLYSSIYPDIKDNIDNLYTMRTNDFDKYIGRKTGLYNNSQTKLSTIIYQPDIIYILQRSDVLMKEINAKGEAAITQTNTLIQEIDQELKTRFNYKGKTDKTLP